MLKRLSKALTSDPLKARHKRQIATTVKRNTQHHQKATFVTISYEIIGIWQLLEWMEQTTHQQHQKSTKTAAYRFSARNSRKLSTINFIWCGKLCLSIFLIFVWFLYSFFAFILYYRLPCMCHQLNYATFVGAFLTEKQWKVFVA